MRFTDTPLHRLLALMHAQPLATEQDAARFLAHVVKVVMPWTAAQLHSTRGWPGDGGEAERPAAAGEPGALTSEQPRTTIMITAIRVVSRGGCGRVDGRRIVDIVASSPPARGTPRPSRRVTGTTGSMRGGAHRA